MSMKAGADGLEDQTLRFCSGGAIVPLLFCSELSWAAASPLPCCRRLWGYEADSITSL